MHFCACPGYNSQFAMMDFEMTSREGGVFVEEPAQ